MMKADGSLSILVDEFINSVWEVPAAAIQSGVTPIRPVKLMYRGKRVSL
jgi:hypothetical protein